ncbi:hypothetical protein IFR04_007936 [Cadophora malorum]|uniref:Uncharacterized protein n=1 Tax=Cadophora malorum TaxID=108018 RepID=A0A8H7W6G3_9HELO|nr:hypothetical protein IFR04_007936 [Cadophora malorum]
MVGEDAGAEDEVDEDGLRGEKAEEEVVVEEVAEVEKVEGRDVDRKGFEMRDILGRDSALPHSPHPQDTNLNVSTRIEDLKGPLRGHTIERVAGRGGQSMKSDFEERSRGHSATGYLARILSGTPSAATERLREYVAEIEDDSEEEERVGDTGQRLEIRNRTRTVVENQLHGLGAVFGSARLSLSRPIRHNADASICWSIVGGVELAEFRKCLCCAQAFLKCWRRSSSTYCLSSCLGSSKERAREVPRYASLSSSQCPDRNPMPEALPGAAFDDQFRQVDAAARDLQVTNLQLLRAGSNSNATCRIFRTSQLDPRTVPMIH